MRALSGKTALVTGAGKGMGRAIARMFAAEGAKVAVTGRNGDDARIVADAIGTEAIALRLDVASRADWKWAVAEVERAWGKLNILVNCAGICEPASIEQADDDNWQRHMSINLDGVFYGCQTALPLMKSSGESGSVINISSSFSQRPSPGYAAYCTSKAAMTTFTKVLALECAASGCLIRANTVHPGGTETDMFEKALADSGLPREEIYAHYVSIHPMGRLGKPEEVARACLWLASDASSFTTGIELNVDGGCFIHA